MVKTYSITYHKNLKVVISTITDGSPEWKGTLYKGANVIDWHGANAIQIDENTEIIDFESDAFRDIIRGDNVISLFFYHTDTATSKWPHGFDHLDMHIAPIIVKVYSKAEAD